MAKNSKPRKSKVSARRKAVAVQSVAATQAAADAERAVTHAVAEKPDAERPAAPSVEIAAPVSVAGHAESWTMNFAPEVPDRGGQPPLAMLMQAAKSVDPAEDRALALWAEGRKEEAIAFLERQIAEERSAGRGAVEPHVATLPLAVPPVIPVTPGAPPVAVEASEAPAVVAGPPTVPPVIVTRSDAPPVAVAPVVAAQAMAARPSSARFRYLGVSALALLVIAGGALAWSNRDYAEAVLADASISVPESDDVGAAFVADPAADAEPVVADERPAEIAAAVPEVAPVSIERPADPVEDPGRMANVSSAPDDARETGEIVLAEASVPSEPELSTVAVAPAEPELLVLPVEEPTREEPIAVAEATPPPRVDEQVAEVVDLAEPVRNVRQVGEGLATEWPASNGSAPPRAAAGDGATDAGSSEPPRILTEAEVAALTEVETLDAFPQDETSSPEVAAAEESPPVAAEPANVAVTLPLGHFQFSGGSAAPDGTTPQLADLASLGSEVDENAMRVPRARPQPTMAAYQQVPPPDSAPVRQRRAVVAEAYEPPARPRRQVYVPPPVVYRNMPPDVAYNQALADGYVIVQQDQARYFRPRAGRVYVVPAPAQPRRYEIIGRVPGW